MLVQSNGVMSNPVLNYGPVAESDNQSKCSLHHILASQMFANRENVDYK